MKLEDMKIGIKYIVTKTSDDESLHKGDHITLDTDRSLCSITTHGWLSRESVKQACIGMECEPDREWADNKIKQLQKELERIFCNYIFYKED